MKRKSAFFLLSLLGILSISYVWISKSFRKEIPIQEPRHFKYQQAHYFASIPISKFTAANQPCLAVQFNDETVSVMLDLGFRGHISFSSDFLDRIKHKKYLRSKKMYGALGHEYEEKLYEGPTMHIGPLSFSGLLIHEHSDKFHENATLFIKEGEMLSTPEPGRVGWELFENTNLLLDLKNSKIAFCDSLDTLKNRGYPTESFIKTALLVERGLVECEAESPERPLLCMLDTGATCNVVNSEKSIDSTVEYTSLKIGGQEMGPITFHCFPIKMPIHIEAILGMEFFQNHVVFLDFAENSVYFLKTK